MSEFSQGRPPAPAATAAAALPIVPIKRKRGRPKKGEGPAASVKAITHSHANASGTATTVVIEPAISSPGHLNPTDQARQPTISLQMGDSKLQVVSLILLVVSNSSAPAIGSAAPTLTQGGLLPQPLDQPQTMTDTALTDEPNEVEPDPQADDLGLLSASTNVAATNPQV
jgi:hypothetical protein